MTEFLQLVVVGLSTGSAFALVGMSLVLVYRTTGIVNFAQGVFAVIGGSFMFRSAKSPAVCGKMYQTYHTSAAISTAIVMAGVIMALRMLFLNSSWRSRKRAVDS